MSDSILVDEIHICDDKMMGKITLNAPKSLNSLTLEMIKETTKQLKAWESNENISVVWLEGSGDKAFCAGGDIVKLYKAMDTNEYSLADEFFVHEYSLDLLIHKYSKPIIAWGSGIVMGGGMGLMQGSKFRLVTETSSLAMPEITIGLYPDVGASYFLHKSPKAYGLFAGLTGARLNASDALFMNFADYYIHSSKKEALFEALKNMECKSSDEQNYVTLTDLLMNACEEAPEVPSMLQAHSKWIESNFSPDKGLDEIDEAIRVKLGLTNKSEDKWLYNSLNAYANGSPTSAAVIFDQYRRSKDWKLEEAFGIELAISANFAREHDFREGVRALLIDKDGKAKWKPSSLDKVSKELRNKFFEMPKGADLKLI